jgi:hypothetical protein
VFLSATSASDDIRNLTKDSVLLKTLTVLDADIATHPIVVPLKKNILSEERKNF